MCEQNNPTNELEPKNYHPPSIHSTINYKGLFLWPMRYCTTNTTISCLGKVQVSSP